MSKVKFKVISAHDLSSPEISAWSELQRADRTVDSPFLGPEYTAAVAAACGNVEVTVMERDGAPVGFFPFQRYGDRVGRAIATPMSDMNGVVAAPDLQWTAEELLRQSGLSTWHFDHLVASQIQFQHHHAWLDDSMYMDLQDGFDTYQEQRLRAGSTLIKQARRKSRRLSRDVGPLRFELHTRDAAVVNRLIEWKQRQLTQSGFLDVFRFKWFLSLIELVLEADTETFSGLLSALYAGDRLLSIHLGIRGQYVLASWIPTYDHEYRQYSPGLLLHIEMARRAAEEGIKRIDLGRGGNQLQTRLASGAIPVAIGVVEFRSAHRLFWRGRYAVRRIAQASSLRRSLRRLYRIGRSWINDR